eukprot:766383-Hanusia_phi.AAC.5
MPERSGKVHGREASARASRCRPILRSVAPRSLPAASSLLLQSRTSRLLSSPPRHTRRPTDFRFSQEEQMGSGE